MYIVEEYNSLIVRKELQKYIGIPYQILSQSFFSIYLTNSYQYAMETLNKNKIQPADSSFEAKDQQVLVERGEDRL